MKKKHVSFLLLLLIFTSNPILKPISWNNPDLVISNVETQPAHDPFLIIYALDSLFPEWNYNYIEAFANFSRLDLFDIMVLRFPDANTMLAKLVLEKDNPVADVVIGLDNILIHKAREHNLFLKHESTELVNVSSVLINNLDPDMELLPYDYDMITLCYDETRINNTLVPGFDSLTLDDIYDLNLAKSLIVEDPTTNSLGLGFLLWIIAVYGDPTLELEGLLEKDWRTWWVKNKDDLRIAASLEDAYLEWSNPAQTRELMVSYGSKTAQRALLYNKSTEKAIISKEGATNNAWLQIEGIGVVNNTKSPTLSKKFVDWFLSPPLQNQIATNNWKHPANKYAEIDPQFQEFTYDLDEINILNDLIDPTILSSNLDYWLDEWEAVIAGEYDPLFVGGYFSLGGFITLGIFCIASHVNRKNVSRKSVRSK